jgi:hypothetical protein
MMKRILCKNARGSIGSSTDVPTNYATKAWRSAGAHASSHDTKPRVGRRQAKETSSREKGDIS